MPPTERRPPVPEAWLLPPTPADPELRARWDALPFESRQAIGRRSVRPTEAAGPDADLVAAVAARRVARAGRSAAAAAGVGWLVFMTIWGFGRAGYPAVADRFLIVGLAAGAVVAVVGVVRSRRRTARAWTVLRTLGADPRPQGSVSRR